MIKSDSIATYIVGVGSMLAFFLGGLWFLTSENERREEAGYISVKEAYVTFLEATTENHPLKDELLGYVSDVRFVGMFQQSQIETIIQKYCAKQAGEEYGFKEYAKALPFKTMAWVFTQMGGASTILMPELTVVRTVEAVDSCEFSSIKEIAERSSID